MLIERIIRYFIGSVRFKAENGFCEKLINKCRENDIDLLKCKRTAEGIVATVTAKNYKRLLPIAEKCNIKITEANKKGAFFVARKYKFRYGIVVGAVVFFLTLLIMQNFIWKIDVVGNERVRTDEILSELDGIGVHKMGYIPSIDFRMKKQQALLRLPELSWLTINRNGSNLTVTVAERHIPPYIDDNQPCNIVAGKTGLILHMEVYNGTKLASEKHTVSKGETLVLGSFQNKKGEFTNLHADAKVIAQVQFEKTISIDIAQLSKEFTGVVKKRSYLKIGSLKMPLFIATPLKGDFDRIAQTNDFSLFGIDLPFGLITESYNFYEKKEADLSLDEARGILSNAFRQYEAYELSDSAIISREVEEDINNGIMSVTIKYVAEQDIARKVPIIENSDLS